MKAIKLLAGVLLAQSTEALAPFAECDKVLDSVSLDNDALNLLKTMNDEKTHRFSSQCLEIVLKKNFMDTANYLLTDYYPSTQIDTEIIVKSVAADIAKQQNYILYRLLKLEATQNNPEAEYPKVVTPMVYQAQSTEHVHFMVRMHELVDDLDCNVTYDHEVEIREDGVDVSVLCFENESDIKVFKRSLQLPRKVVVQESRYTWESESKVHFELKKADGPGYWPVLIEGMPAGKHQDIDQSIGLWKKMHDKYIEQVEDYMTVMPDGGSDEL